MSRLILMLAIATVVAVIVALANRQRPSAAASLVGALPSHVSRADFARPDVPWLVLVFSAESCLACAAVIDWVRGLETDRVAVQVAEVSQDAELHARYAIDSVPATLLVDTDGGVHAGYFGPLSPTGQQEILKTLG